MRGSRTLDILQPQCPALPARPWSSAARFKSETLLGYHAVPTTVDMPEPRIPRPEVEWAAQPQQQTPPLGTADSRPPRARRRARAVCRRCHEKKIKCDLESQRSGSNPPCLNCTQSKSECILRPSRRNIRRREPAGGTDQCGTNLIPCETGTQDNVCYGNSEPSVYGLLSLPPITQSVYGESLQAVTARPISQAPAEAGPLTTQAPLASIQTETAFLDHVQTGFRPCHSQVPEHQTSSGNDPQASYLDESGYMPLLSDKQHTPNSRSGGPVTIDIHVPIHPLPPSLRMSYTELVLKNCQTFCPVLDAALLNTAEFENSLSLHQAIALVGSAIQPSLLHAERPIGYYEKAKLLIQGGYEPNPLASLIAVMLFYWRAASPPTIVSMDSVWWWVGVAVRQAQEIGLHREPKSGQPLRAGESLGLRRRIWWTLFARERLTAICQGRPCIINQHDCNVQEPTPSDFLHPNDQRTVIFIHWISLCTIVGRVGDHLRRNPGSTQAHNGLLDELKNWAHSLPESLRLPFSTNVTMAFDADVYQLYLPYLACVTLLRLKKSAESVPTAYTTAILSASCTARIFEEFLVRGSLRFLQGMAGWYIAVALLALLSARQDKSLRQAADGDIRVLRTALREMAKNWDSAKMYTASIDELLNKEEPAICTPAGGGGGGGQRNDDQGLSVRYDTSAGSASQTASGSDEHQHGASYFPGTSSQTSALFGVLLRNGQHSPFSDFDQSNDLSYLLYDIFDNPLDGVNCDLTEPLTGWGVSFDQ